MPILDDDRGGEFSVRPAGAATIESRAYVRDSLVLRTVWRQGAARLTTDEALLLKRPPALLRAMRADGGTVDVQVRVRPAAGATAAAVLRDELLVFGAPSPVQVTAPVPWSSDEDGGHCRFAVSSGEAAHVVLTAAGTHLGNAADALEETVRTWTARVAPAHAVALRADAERVLGAGRCHELLGVSAAVLSGLRHEGGGIVAAPTTSLPQWPGSARCWDYRYCWLRDAALAGQALLRLGMVDTAYALGAFMGAAVAADGVRPLVRVDGTEAPPERTDAQLAGYRGARPVRFGNAAAEQLQLDVAGEALEFAFALAKADALPGPLGAAVAPLAAWIAHNWEAPDHGIWEIRGAPRRYTHSRVMAWLGLDRAARLAGRGLAAGDEPAWRAAATRVRAATLPSGGGALQLHTPGGGADAALTQAVQNGFLDAAGPEAVATLDLIATELDDAGLLQRYQGSRDLLADPCAPFVFPTFWMATAEAAAGRDGSRWLRAAVAAASPLGLFGEVRDPESGGPLGNFPQVQSHAALVGAVAGPERVRVPL